MKRGSLTQAQKLSIANALVTRAALVMQMGKSYGGDRDLYTALGYPTAIAFEQYLARYNRQDIAKRLINAYPDACWSKPPEIKEIDGEDTPFEKSWKELLDKIPIWHYLKRIDRISGIGRYGVLLIGFDDGGELNKPVRRASRVLYLRPFWESSAQVLKWETDINNERYGLPSTYNLTISQPPVLGGEQMSGKLMEVHWTRVIHVAEECTTDDVYGTPRLEAVYNRLQDLEMIAGGGAEMWWRGAFPGMAFSPVDGAAFSTDATDVTALETEIENYIHGLTRYMKLRNIKAEQFQPQPSDATKPFEVEITLISVASGIPKRILMGTERGELASGQDASEWDDRVEERRVNFCAPNVLKPFIDRLIMVGVLKKPAKGYSTSWYPMHIMGEKEKAEIAKTWTESITKYAGTPGTEFVIPVVAFLRRIMGLTDDEVRKIMEDVESKMQEEREEMKKFELEAKAEAERLATERSDGGRRAPQAV